MSSDYDLIALLSRIQTAVFKFGGPILMFIGTTSCVFSLAVFTRKNLRKNPCSIYFIAYNVSNLLLIYTSILTTTLAYGYGIDPTSYSLIFCRLRFYAMYMFDVLGPSYLILTSIDRILLTSRNALTRQRSTHRLAYMCITSVTLFWLLAHSHALILMSIVQFAPGIKICYFQPGLHNIIMGYYSAIIKGILIPLLMLILGLWTIKNVRNIGRVVPDRTTTANTIPAIDHPRPVHSKDHQLIRMLLFDISIYIFFTLLPSSFIMYQQVTQNQSQTLLQSQIQIFLLLIGVYSGYIPPCVSFYTNLLASKTFRHEIKNIMMCK